MCGGMSFIWHRRGKDDAFGMAPFLNCMRNNISMPKPISIYVWMILVMANCAD